MPPGLTTRWPGNVPPGSRPMSASTSAWSMRFGAALRLLGMDVMPLEAIKIGATLYEQSGHLSPEHAAALYAANHQPSDPRSDSGTQP